MKSTSYLKTAVLLAGFAACGLSHGADQPKITVDEFRSKLKKDESPLPAGGQLVMSYASVVDKIMPSVVTITSTGKVKGRMDGMPQIPPNMEPFFRRFFGLPDDGDNPFDDQEEQPRRRKGPGSGQQPRQQPKEREERLGLGSGMIITTDGYILTNNHVIKDADKLDVAVDLPGGATKTYQAKVIGHDPLTDVALIKIDATGLPPATIADSAKLRVGDIVLAAGAPMELAHSVTQGIVSALGRSNVGIVGEGRAAGYENFIQTDASINPGNSGGPLVDALGRVVGINTAIFSRSGMNAGIGFAIPVSMALGVVEDLLAHGKVERGFLGVQIRDVDQDMAKDLGLSDQSGAVVMSVGKDSPAGKAGVEVGDVIVAVAGKKVADSGGLRLIVSSNKPGSKIALDIIRDKKKLTVNATLDVLPEEALAGAMPGGQMPRSGGGSSELIAGVTAQDITPELEEKYSIAKGAGGVVVTKVDPNSSAAAVGLTEGDVIQAVNRTPVKNLGEAKAQVNAKDKKQAVFLKVNRKGDSILLVVRD
ncbi:MAG: Do family serine endopeptidase [Verrucomicrobiaceae bacterium]|nr:Do family serine endopeptidase [Verrucomicrobiaceae bacterium]